MTPHNRRLVIGPRGGEVSMAVTCLSCISLRSCAPAAITEPWGCESWVDIDRRRVVIGAPEVVPAVEQTLLFEEG